MEKRYIETLALDLTKKDNLYDVRFGIEKVFDEAIKLNATEDTRFQDTETLSDYTPVLENLNVIFGLKITQNMISSNNIESVVGNQLEAGCYKFLLEKKN